MSVSGWRRRQQWSRARREAHRCSRKIRHATEREAKKQIAELIAAGKAKPGEMSIYDCAVCGGFHVGHHQRENT